MSDISVSKKQLGRVLMMTTDPASAGKPAEAYQTIGDARTHAKKHATAFDREVWVYIPAFRIEPNRNPAIREQVFDWSDYFTKEEQYESAQQARNEDEAPPQNHPIG